MNNMTARLAAGACLLLGGANAPAAVATTPASAPRCATDALAQAPKLLTFHLGRDDDRAAIEPAAKALPSIVNPANRKQEFDVIEVWANVYKGRYRMRFEYFPMTDGTCVLMGQEILEYARP